MPVSTLPATAWVAGTPQQTPARAMKTTAATMT
jgi:hypothetical protein